MRRKPAAAQRLEGDREDEERGDRYRGTENRHKLGLMGEDHGKGGKDEKSA